MPVTVQGHVYTRPVRIPITGEFATGADVNEYIKDGETASFGLGRGSDGRPITVTFGSSPERVNFSVQGNAEVLLGGMPISSEGGTASTEVKARNPIMPNFHVSARP